MELLLSGDIHIGRASSRVDEPGAHRSADAWGALCDLAIQRGAGAVCLSGDITDEDNRFWEAIGPLEEGVARLAERGIPVLAVSGNHDCDVLTSLADQLPDEQFILLGRDGQWQRHTLTDDAGRVLLHVDGWSFPQKRVTDDPLSRYDLPRPTDAPVLGMVHGDLNAPASPYAPLSAERLATAGPDAWLLGHVHTPALHQPEGCWLLYPGSPQALDPGEPGAHGPWLTELHAGVLLPPEMIPHSSVRYDRMEIDLSGCEDLDAARSEIRAQIHSRADKLVETGGPRLSRVVLRLRLVGRTPIAAALQRQPDALREFPSGFAEFSEARRQLRASRTLPDALRETLTDYRLTRGSAQITVEPPQLALLGEINVEQYARQNSAAGAAARVLMELGDDGDPSDQTRRLLTTTGEAMRREADGCDGIEPMDISEELVRRTLIDRARALLNELVRQQEDQP